MTLDLKPMLRGEVKRIAVDYRLTPDEMYGVRFCEDLHACGEVTDNAGYMRLSLSISVPYVAECARCLDEVSGEFREVFERTVVTKGAIDEDKLEESVDEYAVLDEDGKLDVDDEILETLVLLFPKKILCREDCEGLCQRCGKPKKDGDCGCPTKEIDPRLAVLKKLLDNPEK
ncbi:MAG: DUF177 domain-containing protein [Ruminococcaceae bacterium]|nr:DUF177 domain-containing protein [Oscillospiraceae bacterium]